MATAKLCGFRRNSGWVCSGSRSPAHHLRIHPIAQPEDRGAALLRALSAFDDALVDAMEASQRETADAMQDREAF